MIKDLEIYNENGELTIGFEKNWLINYINDNKDIENINTIISFEDHEVKDFCNICDNKAVLEIINTNNLKSILKKVSKQNTYLLIKAKEEVDINEFIIFSSYKVNCFVCLGIDNSIKQKFQVGILYPKN